jgi:hypothetical protein
VGRLECRLEGIGGTIGWAIQKNVTHCVDGDRARNLSTLLTAHSVRDHRKPATPLHLVVVFGLGVAIIVFVLAPLATNIC